MILILIYPNNLSVSRHACKDGSIGTILASKWCVLAATRELKAIGQRGKQGEWPR